MYNPTENEHLSVFKGVPQRHNTQERNSWQKFLGFFIPWLGQKHQLGERYLEAKVLNEEAQAFNTYAEGLVKIETAKKIARESASIEAEKLAQLESTTFTDEVINQKLQEIEEKISQLSIFYGTTIISGKKNDVKDTPSPSETEQKN